MKTAGLIMMLSAWGIIIFLCVYCFYRLFAEKKK
jgi:hypothetical protein